MLLIISVVCLLAIWQTMDDLAQVETIRREWLANRSECPPDSVGREEVTARVSWAKRKFLSINNLPDQFSDAFYYALSYYPELEKTAIEFVHESIGTTLQVQPTPSTVFARAGQRTYRISINNDPDFDGVLFADVPLNAQIGVFAHELAHIVDYQHKNFLQMVGTALKFTNNMARSSYEQSIDMLTIYRGFGQHIWDWTYYLEEESVASASYKAFKKRIYYSNAQLAVLVTTHRTVCDLDQGM